MANARRITIEFLGKDKSLGKTADGIEGKTSKLGDRFKKFGKVAAAGFAVAGAAAVAGGKYLFDVGSRLEQMGMKAETVFGNQLGSVEKWSKANAHAMGLTSREATGLAANFADLLIPMGFTRKQAAGMSTDVVGLSGALSQWSGGTVSAAEASDILAKAMLGETDGLKQLGISISAAEIDAELLRKGQDKLTGSALAQAKATATQTLIMNKSTDAQEAFAKGGSPLLSAQAKIKAAFGEVRDELAMKLLPVFSKVSTWIADKGLPAFTRISASLSKYLGPIFQSIGGFLTKTFIPAVKDLVARFTGAKDGTDKVGKAMKDAEPYIRMVKAILSGLGVVFKKVLLPVMGKIADHALPLIGKALGLVGRLAMAMWNKALQPAFKFMVRAIGEVMIMWGKMLRALAKVPGFGWAKKAGEAMGRAGEKAVDLSEDIKKIPDRNVRITADTSAALAKLGVFKSTLAGIDNRFIQLQANAQNSGRRAHGGSVMRSRGYLVGERGPEWFSPNTNGRISSTKDTMAAATYGTHMGGGVSINVTVNGVIGGRREVGREVEKALNEWVRSQGRGLAVPK